MSEASWTAVAVGIAVAIFFPLWTAARRRKSDD